MDAPNPVEGTKHVARGIKGKVTGHKPIVYVIMGVGVIAIAWYLRKRSSTAGSSPLPTADAGSMATDPNLDGSYYPDPTQGAGSSSGGTSDPGAYGGYPTPDLASFFDNLTAVLGNAADSGESPSTTDTGGGAPTDGANPATAGTVHSDPAVTQASKKTVSPYPGFPYQSSRGWYRLVTPPDGSRWHYYGPKNDPKVMVEPPKTAAASTHSSPGAPVVISSKAQPTTSGGVGASPSPSAVAVHPSPYGAKYPYHDGRGWYRLVLPPGGKRFHYYGPNDSPKVQV